MSASLMKGWENNRKKLLRMSKTDRPAAEEEEKQEHESKVENGMGSAAPTDSKDSKTSKSDRQSFLSPNRNLIYKNNLNERHTTVLLIDTNRSSRIQVKSVLTKRGYIVDDTSDFELVYGKSLSNIDTIIMELSSPAFKAVPLLEYLSETPIKIPIILTISDEISKIASQIEMCINNGACGYLCQPVKPNQLCDKVEVLVRRFNKTATLFKNDLVAGPSNNQPAVKRTSVPQINTTSSVEKVKSIEESYSTAVCNAKEQFLSRLKKNRIKQLSSSNQLAEVTAKLLKKSGTNRLRRSSRRISTTGREFELSCHDATSIKNFPVENLTDKELSREYYDRIGRDTTYELSDMLQSEFKEIIPHASCKHMLQHGHHYRVMGNYKDAIKVYTRVIHADNVHWAAYLCRGVAHHYNGNNVKAIRDFNKVLEMDPANTAAMFNKALLAYTSADYKQAVVELKKAIQIDPNDTELLSCRAFIYRRLHLFENAKEDYVQRELLAVVSPAVDEFKPDNNPISTHIEWDTNNDGRIDLQEYMAANNLEEKYGQILTDKADFAVALDKAPGERSVVDCIAIFKFVQEIEFLAALPKDVLSELCKVLEYEVASAGECIAQQGTAARNFFVLIEGSVNIKCKAPDIDTEHVVNQLKAGDFFGEQAIQSSSNRLYSAVASDITHLLVIPRRYYLKFNLHAAAMCGYEERLNALKRSGIFNSLNISDLRLLTSITRCQTIHRDKVILQQGKKPTCFYLIVSGFAKVYQYADKLANLQRRELQLKEKINCFEMQHIHHHSLHVYEKPVDMDSERWYVSADKQVLHPINAKDRADATLATYKDELHDIQRKLSSMTKPPPTPTRVTPKSLPRKLSTIPANPGGNGSTPKTKPSIIQVGRLYPCDFFGELALLDPTNGRERGTIASETAVKVLPVTAAQLNVLRNSSKLIEQLQSKCFSYQEDKSVVDKQSSNVVWDKYKKRVIKKIDKHRWPLASNKKVVFLSSGETDVVTVERRKDIEV